MTTLQKVQNMKAMCATQYASSSFDNLDKIMSIKSIPICKPTSKQLLVKVLACSISPGDKIMMKGKLIFLRRPFPFIPGMDICGEVVDPNGSTQFKVGDLIVASNGFSPTGGMAEYMAVDKSEAVLKPKILGINESAACSSAITARNAVMDHVLPGDRVLILGGSGGVGLSAIQFAKHQAKASFVATTSTQTELCAAAGADLVLNYRQEKWWEYSWEKKFDKIIDTVGGGNFDRKAHLVLKTNKAGGEFVAVVGDNPDPDVSSLLKVLPFMWEMMRQPLMTRLFPRRNPKYTLLAPYNVTAGRKEVLDLMAKGEHSIEIENRCPCPFTDEGVREAFRIVASGHAHGKVIVSMEFEDEELLV